MSAELPDQAIEAVARERYERDVRIHKFVGGQLPTPPFDESPERQRRLTQARDALLAVAPAFPHLQGNLRDALRDLIERSDYYLCQTTNRVTPKETRAVSPDRRELADTNLRNSLHDARIALDEEEK